jgi:hypothetical protein
MVGSRWSGRSVLIRLYRPRTYICAMPPKRPTAAKLRNRRVSILRLRAHYLGIVEASDEKAAEASQRSNSYSTTSSAGGLRCGRRSSHACLKTKAATTETT